MGKLRILSGKDVCGILANNPNQTDPIRGVRNMWQLQEAKACLSELVRKAAKEGSQKITVHGKLAAVVISSKEYERLKNPKGSFVKFMRNSPLYGLELDLRREQTLTCEAESL